MRIPYVYTLLAKFAACEPVLWDVLLSQDPIKAFNAMDKAQDGYVASAQARFRSRLALSSYMMPTFQLLHNSCSAMEREYLSLVAPRWFCLPYRQGKKPSGQRLPGIQEHFGRSMTILR